MNNERQTTTLKNFLWYFLYLGCVGFGGPIVLIQYMHRDLVTRRNWVSSTDYAEGVALAQMAPGPLSTQLAIYLGWIKSGTLGATLVGLAFILPSFLMVIVLAELYKRFHGLPWVTKVFYGIGAIVITIIAKSAYQLAQKTLDKDKLLWGLAVISAGMTVAHPAYMVWVFFLCGLTVLFMKAPPRGIHGMFSLIPAWLVTEIQAKASLTTLWDIGFFFTKAGAVVFGSGYAVIPFLHSGIVGQFHWVSEQQFVDAVAVAMITPGPILICAGFLGYLMAGFLGALVATIAIFLPCYLVVVLTAPYYHRFAQHRQVKAFLTGIIAAAIGAIAGSAVILAKKTIVDIPTAAIAIIGLAVLLMIRHFPEPVLVIFAGIAGLLLKS